MTVNLGYIHVLYMHNKVTSTVDGFLTHTTLAPNLRHIYSKTYSTCNHYPEATTVKSTVTKREHRKVSFLLQSFIF